MQETIPRAPKPTVKLIDAGNLESATELPHVELDHDPGSADILSLTGFSYRKTGKSDKEYSKLNHAIDNYREAATNS